MKKLQMNVPGIRELGREELKNAAGGGGLRSFVLGVTIFGMARICGVMVGCASL